MRPAYYHIDAPEFDPRGSLKSKHQSKQKAFHNYRVGDARYLARVDSSADLSVKKLVEKIAYYFRREFHYDTAPYIAENHSPDFTAYLFLGWEQDGAARYDYYVVGACVFKSQTDVAGRAGLCWIWLHPYERRQGRLSVAWPYFKEAHGQNFAVSSPRSSSMEAFLTKVGHKLR